MVPYRDRTGARDHVRKGAATMDLIVVLAVVAGLVALPVAAVTHGADSRDAHDHGAW
jgi:hypothetical protein